ncbi:c-type cytochrome [Pseudohongiella spirulinae]|uniref:Cytochrome c5 n=1 Tax=Pseudohongiella spirulinae TaxID=1249552 RepID=A0A0S2K8U9_9GAMM|nr:c-type cytochrome [Pseudohongiella spirulinae]ALO44774.1 Cytochrome c5 [Pseudohongiella spirulinae]
MLNLGLKSRVVKLALLVMGIGIAGSVVAQSARDQMIADRLAPVGQVCLAGEDCASGAAPAVAQAAGGGAFDVEASYNQYCAMCHNTGMAGAPTREAADHWTTRMSEDGFDTVLANAINGINAMPARGMCATCSDDEMSELVEYLSGHSPE